MMASAISRVNMIISVVAQQITINNYIMNPFTFFLKQSPYLSWRGVTGK